MSMTARQLKRSRTHAQTDRVCQQAIVVAWSVVVGATMMTLAGGCASKAETASVAETRMVSVQDFSGVVASSEPIIEVPAGATESAAETAPTIPQAVSTSTPSATMTQPPARTTPGRMLLPGQEAVIESVIGQVSGRPIFADSFLEPIADQLRQESERLGREEFIQRARTIISERLQQVVLNELFLAEAEASLTEQQQMGLLAFLRDLQERNIAERGGTIFGAQAKIAEEQEMTLQEFERAQKDDALIRNLLYRRVAPRVIVSWRDVQREYELRKAEFNPPATVTLKRLVLDPTSQADVIEQVRASFADGKAFDEVVETHSLQAAVSYVGGDGRFTLASESLGDVELAESLKIALAKLELKEGQTTEEVAMRSGSQWLTVEKIERRPAQTLFDVQERLVAELQARRFNEEYLKYIDTLFAKGIYDEMDMMVRRALAVVVLRYAR